MASDKRFYVYQFTDAGVVAYIGKGSGNRFSVQSKRFQYDGEIIAYFASERDAYKAECRYIAERSPTLNKCRGGNGNRVKRPRRRHRDRLLREIELVGTRRYAARLLLGCERANPGVVDPSKIDVIRQVANGPRC